MPRRVRRWVWTLALCGLAQVGESIEEARKALEQGQPQLAEQILERILAHEPRNAAAHQYLGMIRFQTRRLDSAEEHLAEAVKLNPKGGAAWKMLGMVRAARGDFRAADEPFRKACELEPKDPDACYYLGRNSYAISRFEDALAAFDKAAKTRRNPWRVDQGAGLALEALGRTEEAERRLRRAVARAKGEGRPGDDPRIELGSFLLRQSRPQEALPLLDSALNDFPQSARGHFEMASVLSSLERDTDALAHLREAVKLEPDYWPAHLLLSKVCFRLGRVEEGRRHAAIGREGTLRQNQGSTTLR